MKNITKEWLSFANDDLKVIEKILEDKELTNIVAFHAHQTVEKCFKAVAENKKPKFGCLKEKIWMAPDFNEPLDDFKEYMK